MVPETFRRVLDFLTVPMLLLLKIPSRSLIHPPEKVQSALQTHKIQLFILKKAISETDAGEEERKQKAQHAAKIPLCITNSHFRHICVM